MLSREELLELADKEVAGIAGADFDNPEQMARVKGIMRVVLDEHGNLIQMLPGLEELKEGGLGTYKKQMRAAFRGILAKLWRKGISKVFSNSNTQAILDTCHALKQDLGKDWKKFYANLLVGEDSDGLLKHLAEQGDIDAAYIKQLIENTGWIFNKHPLQIYETKIEQTTKQALATGGGLYKIMVEIKPDEFRTFFAKKHAKKDEYERTLKIQPMLSKITDKVSPIIAKDSDNDITVEKYINGETLTHAFKRILEREDFLEYIKDPVERESQKKLVQKLNDQKKKSLLIPALDELIEISQAVGKNKFQFEGIRTLGGAGKSFIDWFKEKYKPSDDNLVALIKDEITWYMDMEQTVFCHGDAHTDNVIEQLHKPHWIDWEYAHFSIPQMDLAKFLKKTGLSKEAEEDIVRHACEKRGWNDYNLFSRIYYKTKILDSIISAAKYRKMSFDSRKHRAEKQAQADIYFTDALRLIEEDETIHDDKKVELVQALEKDAKGRFTRLDDDEYNLISKELDPYKNASIENLGTPSIMEKYSKPPLKERIDKLWMKHGGKVIAGAALAGAIIFGAAVYKEVQKKLEIAQTKIERTSQYDSGMETNEKLMPLVPKYTPKYDNISEDELAAVINAAHNYNKGLYESFRSSPDFILRDVANKSHRQMFQLKNGLSEEQSFVKEEHLEDPENNVFAAAKRLSDMKKEFSNIEDAILAFYTSPEFVRSWKNGKSYWDYSKEERFGFDGSFHYDYQKLTDMALAYLKK